MSYTYYLTDTSNSVTVSSGFCYSCNVSYTGWHTCTHYCYHLCGCGPNKATVVYKYQIVCPKCETKMWAEMDETVKCTKCKSKILVREKKDHDYEVEV